LRSVKRLYAVRTRDRKLFEEKKPKSSFFSCFQKKDQVKKKDSINALDLKEINLYKYDSFCLFLLGIFGKFFPFKKCWPKYKKMKKIFDEGIERVNNEMNILHIIKLVRETKILLRNYSK
jgi:hypothetical protein